jgi:hypothetical protein
METPFDHFPVFDSTNRLSAAGDSPSRVRRVSRRGVKLWRPSRWTWWCTSGESLDVVWIDPHALTAKVIQHGHGHERVVDSPSGPTQEQHDPPAR